MKELKIYQVDAFSEKIFGGNPAAIVPLTAWLEDGKLQKIAMENNLSETAFYVKEEEQYQIRWFTPKVEVDLCGHATLASAHVLFEHEGFQRDILHFYSHRSGNLNVKKSTIGLTLDFPTDTVERTKISNEMLGCFTHKPIEAYRGKTDLVLVFQNEEDIRQLQFDLEKIKLIDARGVIATAKGEEVDFVSRFFGPQVGVPEDPVTGSAHTTLTPIWAEKLGKNKLTARQLSQRGGALTCELLGERVEITGKAVTYLEGRIFV
ncbi:PhzF family phenazine biosynthesis protein [Shivajiella indica]|uniref:PhzF family phenazine biosynthesis protein n=1 Tax=Shivajiella indica TaxID=872115 RepID=A0ABW5B8B8_9BACT